jgi:uncharacterized heparinase superfamily protein
VQRCYFAPARFRFLEEEQLIDSPSRWNDPDLPPLWLYNLHYFDDLRATDAASRREEHAALIQRWIQENPWGKGRGWDPYPLSLRIVNWIKWALTGGALSQEAKRSLGLQSDYLSRRLEYHLLGNHLLANAKALAFAGLFFEGETARSWWRRGWDLLDAQLEEQILADGGHFERSPMYHAIILEDVLDLLNLNRAYAAPVAGEAEAKLRSLGTRMLAWLQAMTHPDGELAFFNDASLGIAPCYRELEAYARRLGVPVDQETAQRCISLDASGYVRARLGDASLIADVGEVGPDYQPGHAHADTLSFELSLRDRRILVNSGTSHYGEHRDRLRQRSTAAHNTVEIDGQNSSEVWGSFRVARRARPFARRIDADGGQVRIECSHDGYGRLPGRPVHRRSWTLAERELSIVDEISGGFSEACASFHFAPGIHIGLDGDAGPVSLPDLGDARIQIESATPRVETTTYHPRFGQSIPNEVLRLRFSGPRCRFTLSW